MHIKDITHSYERHLCVSVDVCVCVCDVCVCVCVCACVCLRVCAQVYVRM